MPPDRYSIDPKHRDLLEPHLNALKLYPNSADHYSDLGTALSSVNEKEAARKAYEFAIRLLPTHGVAYNNLASLLRGSPSPAHQAEALQLFLSAHAIQPEQYERFPQMHLNLAGGLVDAGRYSDAIWHYERGLAHTEFAEDTLTRVVHLSQRVCDWRRVEFHWPRLRADQLRGAEPLVSSSSSSGGRRKKRKSRGSTKKPSLSPMHALTLPFTASELYGLARRHAAGFEAAASREATPTQSLPSPSWWRGPQPSALLSRSSRLRVGLMSADFKRHPVGILLAPALAMCKRYCKYLHLTLIPLNPFLPPEASNSSSGSGGGSGNAGKKKKSIRMETDTSLEIELQEDDEEDDGGEAMWFKRLRNGVHELVSLHRMSDADALDALNTKVKPHVLLDFHGLYSRGARPALLAKRASPVQSTHLGYGASTGATFLQYVLADRIALPPTYTLSTLYTEKFVLLPPSHLPNGHHQIYKRMVRHRNGGVSCCPEGTRRDTASFQQLSRLAKEGRVCDAKNVIPQLRKHHSLPPLTWTRPPPTGITANGDVKRSSTTIERPGVVYAFFGQHLKVTERTFEMWTSLLRLSGPSSTLWLLSWPDSKEYLKQSAAAAGIHLKRLRFVERLPQGAHLCAFGLADLALDAPQYASGATGIDTLWSGVPMLAMAGGMRADAHLQLRGSGEEAVAASTIFQRNGVSLSLAAGLPPLVAGSAAGYVQLGLGLGRLS